MSELTRVTAIEELDPLFEKSDQQPVLIFKHSLTCPISTAAFNEYQRFLAHLPDGDTTDYTLIEIQNARPVSTAVAERTGVRHESPQALLVRDQQVVWHASHWKITADSLRQAVSD